MARASKWLGLIAFVVVVLVLLIGAGMPIGVDIAQNWQPIDAVECRYFKYLGG